MAAAGDYSYEMPQTSQEQIETIISELRRRLLVDPASAVAVRHIAAMVAAAPVRSMAPVERRVSRARGRAYRLRWVAVAAAMSVGVASGAILSPSAPDPGAPAARSGPSGQAATGPAAAADQGLCVAVGNGDAEAQAKLNASAFEALAVRAEQAGQTVEGYCAGLPAQAQDPSILGFERNEHGKEVSEVARNTTAEGRAKGEEISSVASSKASTHRENPGSVPDASGGNTQGGRPPDPGSQGEHKGNSS